MAKRWCTKEDVLKDLEEASGRRVPHHISALYCLYGEQPPPRRAVDDEDDELELRFGTTASQGSNQENAAPDLIGITNMLRMVQQYENSSDDDLPLQPNRRIVISKGNSSRTSVVEKSRGHCQKETYKSPNKIHTSVSPQKTTTNVRLSSDKGGNGDNITSDVVVTASEQKEVRPTKIVTNNGTIISNLNPFVNEFIPKKAQIEYTQNSDTTEENFITTRVLPAQNTFSDNRNKTYENEIGNAKLVQKPIEKPGSDITNKGSFDSTDDLTKLEPSVTTGKNSFSTSVDISKEMTKEMAMFLKNQISTKNDSYIEQQQTNRAIVNLLKLYAEPKPAKPLKLLTPEYFEKCKADDKNVVVETTKTDCSLERMTSLHDVVKVEQDETANSSRGSISLDVTVDSLHKDINLKYDDNPVKETGFIESNIVFDLGNCDDNNANDYKNELGMCNQNKNMQDTEKNEEECTQLTPDIGEMSFEEIDAPKENEMIDPYVKESISKVNNWLQDKPVVTVSDKSKSPSPYLGAVGYKRKESLMCKSPSNLISNKVSKPTEYSPSRYAEELHKKFSERNKTVAPTPVLNIWEKLEADLKKKDLEVKSRQGEGK